MSYSKDILLKINNLEIKISQTSENIILEIDPETNKQAQQPKQGNQRKRKAETLPEENNKVQKTTDSDVKTQRTERMTFSYPVKFPQLELPPFAKQMFDQKMNASSPAFSPTCLEEQTTEPTQKTSGETDKEG